MPRAKENPLERNARAFDVLAKTLPFLSQKGKKKGKALLSVSLSFTLSILRSLNFLGYLLSFHFSKKRLSFVASPSNLAETRPNEIHFSASQIRDKSTFWGINSLLFAFKTR